MNGKRSNLLESGQAIFVVALVMIGLIGALGLAVDGGGLAFLYRDAQNAADAAAVAAAYARCTGGDVSAAAIAAAADNGFANGGTNTVTVQSPPTSGAGAGDSNFVSVSVSATKPAYFIQLLYPAGLQASTSAVAQCTPGVSGGAAGAGYAMFGLGSTGGVSATCHSGCQEAEASHLNVNGNVHANGVNEMLRDDTTDTVTVNAGYTNTSSTTTPLANPLAHLSTTQFAPGGTVWARALAAGLATQYTSINWTLNTNNDTRLRGLIYVTGNVTINVNGKTTLPFTIVATGSIRITSATQGMTAYIDDMLAYSLRDNGSTCDSTTSIYIDGAGTSRGIVYAPKGQVEVLYTGGTWTGSLVGKWVDWWGYNSSQRTTLTALPGARPPQVSLAS